jgi:hypothetical protein
VSLDASYVAVSAAMSALFGVGAFVSVILLSRRERAFLSTTYRTWLGVALLLCLATPPLVTWGSSGNISLSDAYLLRKREYFHAGWGKVLIAYSMFLGLALGGLFAAVARRK